MTMPPGARCARRISRRRFLTLGGVSVAVVALLALGCGGEARGGDGSGADPGDTRVVESAYGKARVPEDPRGVVTLDPTVLLDVLALGTTPVGYVGADASQPLFVRERLEDSESVGTESEPNIERVAALEPDLIMGYTQTPKKLSEIAPTVDVEYDETEWKRMFRERAAVLGKEEGAEQKIAGYDARARELRQEMGDRLAEVTVSMVRFGEADVTVYPTSFHGSVLEDVGIKRPPNQAFDTGECCVGLSIEEIPKVDADFIFVAVDPGAGEKLEEYESNPLWGRLKGRKIEVDSATWLQPSYTTATRILDDLDEHVLAEERS